MVNITRCMIQNNQIISSDTSSTKSGGGVFVDQFTTTTIRETSFINNVANTNKGNHISTHGNSNGGIPTVGLVNTYFNNPNDNNMFYTLNTAATWRTCSTTEMCTESPFTGTCQQTSPSNVQFGVTCRYQCSKSNNYFYPTGVTAGCTSIREWTCSTALNEGTFIRKTDCRIRGLHHINVLHVLEIEGTNRNMNSLVTITAATGNRHFKIDNPNAKLTLRYIKLSNGNVASSSSEPDSLGGSILITTNGGELNLYSSIIYNLSLIHISEPTRPY